MRRPWTTLRGWRLAGGLVVTAIAGFVLIQAIPYGRSHAAPQSTKEASWSNPQARAAFNSACADCHSNHTNWRWYSKIAPMSWLIQHDVDSGRGALNLSEWDKPQPGLSEVLAQVSSGEMPPIQYKVAHPSAGLSAKEKRQLIDGLRAIYATDPPPVRVRN